MDPSSIHGGVGALRPQPSRARPWGLATVLAAAAVVAGCAGGTEPPRTPVDNTNPLADAGAAQTVVRGTLVTLDGSASSDPDGDRLLYAWTITARPAGSTADFQAGTADDPVTRFTPDAIGTFVVSLTVTDFAEGSGTDTVSITATAAPPVANAGTDQGVQFAEPSTSVVLNGTGSSDPFGLDLTYSWSITGFVPASGTPPASPVVLANPTTATPSFTVEALDQLGVYTLSLAVNNGFLTSNDEVVITVGSVPPPVANAGPDQDVTFVVDGVTVNLDGSGSSDPGSLPLTYAWQITSFAPASGVPPAIPVTLVNATTATPSFEVTAIDQLGSYTLQLTVSNGTLPAIDTVVINVAKSFPAGAGLIGPGLLGLGAWLGGRWRQRRRARSPATSTVESAP